MSDRNNACWISIGRHNTLSDGDVRVCRTTVPDHGSGPLVYCRVWLELMWLDGGEQGGEGGGVRGRGRGRGEGAIDSQIRLI